MNIDINDIERKSTTTLNIRCETDLKILLIQKADEHNLDLSQLVRGILKLVLKEESVKDYDNVSDKLAVVIDDILDENRDLKGRVGELKLMIDSPCIECGEKENNVLHHLELIRKAKEEYDYLQNDYSLLLGKHKKLLSESESFDSSKFVEIEKHNEFKKVTATVYKSNSELSKINSELRKEIASLKGENEKLVRDFEVFLLESTNQIDTSVFMKIQKSFKQDLNKIEGDITVDIAGRKLKNVIRRETRK